MRSDTNSSADGPCEDERVTDHSPFAGVVPREDAKGAMWVRPEIVVELRFGERTRDGRLRFPRFSRLRSDKAPDEVVDEVIEE